jgi:hypothetical protein
MNLCPRNRDWRASKAKADLLPDFCIHIQPQRAPEMDLDAVLRRCEELANGHAAIERFAMVEGDEEEGYVNLMFATPSPTALWGLLQEQLYGDATLGPLLLSSSIAMREGRHGWDDYLQLHQFDPAIKLDELGEN